MEFAKPFRPSRDPSSSREELRQFAERQALTLTEQLEELRAQIDVLCQEESLLRGRRRKIEATIEWLSE